MPGIVKASGISVLALVVSWLLNLKKLKNKLRSGLVLLAQVRFVAVMSGDLWSGLVR